VVLVYDVTPVTDAAWHGPGVSRLYSAAFDHLAQSRCQVVAVSRNTADHLRVNWGVAPSRLTVLPLGPFGQAYASGAARGPEADRFFLFVGSLEPRKNVAGLLEGYRAARLFAEHNIRLRIIGGVPEQAGELARLARATPGADLLGAVSDAELAAAYRDCLAFVYPSYCEGFGLPLLEALSHGCVCLATRTGASPEIGGKCCVYVDPYSPQEIARGLRRLASLPAADRQRRRRMALRRAEQFTWPAFYDGLSSVLLRAAEALPAPLA
jgi:glycosyltransferase involved in cell wall biosynthesis